MKKQYLIIACLLTLMFSCKPSQIGYLHVDQASYSLNKMVVVKLSDVTEANNPELYKANELRIKNKAPWITSEIEGVLGTDPIRYSIADVKVVGKGDAKRFKEEVSIIGGGRILFPFDFKSPKGLYVISISISNEGSTKVLPDVFSISIQ